MKLAVRILILSLVFISPKLMAEEMRAFRNLEARMQSMNNYTVIYKDGKKTEVLKSASGRQGHPAGEQELEVKLISKNNSKS